MMLNQIDTILQALLDLAIAIAVLLYSRKRPDPVRQFFEFLGAVVFMNLFWELFKLAIGYNLFQEHKVIGTIIFLAFLAPGLLVKDIAIAFLTIKPHITDFGYQVMVIMTVVIVTSILGLILMSDTLGRIIFGLAFVSSLFVAWTMAKAITKSSYRARFLYRYRV